MRVTATFTVCYFNTNIKFSLVLSGTVAARKLRTHLKEDVAFEAETGDSLGEFGS